MSEEQRRVKPPGELSQDPRRLKRRRVIARLGVRQAAREAGISAAFLSLLENGHRSASPEKLGQLADAYGCGIEDLMPREPNGKVA